jgi:uncharacterized metal-binding protein YceD (DUF177 family)
MARAVTHRPASEPPAPHGFRRTVAVAKVGQAGLVRTLAATPSEFAKIADYLGLVGVRTLSAEVGLTRWRDRGVRAVGKLKADVVQSCIVTLDPLDVHIEATFERRFLPEDAPGVEQAAHEVFVDPEGEDPAEPLGRDIDLGEVLVEELSLNLDPYPRKPGAEFQATDEGAQPPRKNPFAVLAKLKPKSDEKT